MAANARGLLLICGLVCYTPTSRILGLEQPALLPDVLVRGNRTRSIGISVGPNEEAIGREVWYNYRYPALVLPLA